MGTLTSPVFGSAEPESPVLPMVEGGGGGMGAGVGMDAARLAPVTALSTAPSVLGGAGACCAVTSVGLTWFTALVSSSPGLGNSLGPCFCCGTVPSCCESAATCCEAAVPAVAVLTSFALLSTALLMPALVLAAGGGGGGGGGGRFLGTGCWSSPPGVLEAPVAAGHGWPGARGGCTAC